MRNLFIIFLIISFWYTAPGQNSFDLTYSTPSDEEVYSGILHSSDNIYLVGRIGDHDSWDFDPLVLKITPEGGLEAREWILDDTNAYFSQIVELENNNIMLIGQLGFGPGSYYTQTWIRIINQDLNVISNHYYPIDTTYLSLYYDDNIIDSESNIVLAGNVEYYDLIYPYRTQDFFMAKYSQAGDSLDFHIYDFPDHKEFVIDLSTFPDSDEYLAITSAFFIGMPYPQFVRISNDLEIVSSKWFSPYQVEIPCTFNHWLTNSTYIFTGLRPDTNGGSQDNLIGVFKADTNTNLIEILDLGKNDTIDYPAFYHSMEYANDSTMYVGGFVNYIAFWTTTPSFVELYLVDTNLNLLGYRQFGGDVNYLLNGIQKTADGGCLLYASTYSETSNPQERDIRIFKVPRDSLNIITSITTHPALDVKQVPPYPNPVTEILHVPLGQYVTNANIVIFKTDGKKVLDKWENASGNIVTLDLRNLPGGIYIYQILWENQPILTGKFIKH